MKYSIYDAFADARRIELRGELAAILGLAGVGATKNGQCDSAEAAALSVQMKVVAGTRNYLDLLLSG